MVLGSLPYTASLCASAPLAAPATQRRTHQLFSLIDLLARAAATSGMAARRAAAPEAECAAVLTWLRLGVGLALPLAYEAVTEAALWQRHEAERQQAGLPREGGALRAAACRHAKWVDWEEGLSIAFVTWLLLALAWQWATLLF